jgi:amino acid transporter
VLTAFSYAELSSRHPVSAGAAVYVQEGFNFPLLATIVGVLVIFTGVVSAATIARGSVGYLQFFLPLPEHALIFLVLFALGSLAAWGVKESALVVALISVIEILGLLLVIFAAGGVLVELPDRWDEFVPPLEWNAFRGIAIGAFLAFYAFIGYEDMVNMAEETHAPWHTLPWSILLSLLIAAILYMTIAAVCVLAAPPDLLAQSSAPLAFVYRQATGADPVVLSAISVVAVVNGALIQIIMAARVCHGMSRRGWIPVMLGEVHPQTRTPVAATVVITLIILILALWLPIETLAKTTSGTLLFVFALVNLALFRIKHTQAPPAHGFIVPHWVPLAGFVVSLSFLLVQFVAM